MIRYYQGKNKKKKEGLGSIVKQWNTVNIIYFFKCTIYKLYWTSPSLRSQKTNRKSAFIIFSNQSYIKKGKHKTKQVITKCSTKRVKHVEKFVCTCIGTISSFCLFTWWSTPTSVTFARGFFLEAGLFSSFLWNKPHPRNRETNKI